ncbi:hypothetical protein [Flavobacterium ajazii]|uniref:hypothetical protein n=1 Tax=Flavobacterium ajazii TaxID=2692318 RepID=UPI0013D2AF60|nr:hypothetical protein [Flavobacterium ajazii]
MIIILEKNFEYNQRKNLFFVLFIIAFVFLGILNSKLNMLMYYIAIILSIIILLLISLLLLKKGIVINEKKVFIGYFLLGKLIAKKEVLIEGFSIISVLIFNKKRNYNYVIRPWEPKLALEMKSFDINLLNVKHTLRKRLLRLEKEKSSNRAIEFLLHNSDLKFENYNPNFD